MASDLSFLNKGPVVPIDCRVALPDFDGPLDLLLHLIKNHELDLLNLPIATITKQYLVYLDYMRELNLDLASDYLVMAATLTFLKSQIILPQELKEEATGVDPRAALVRKLIELKCYKELAASLAARPRLYRDVFPSQNNGSRELEAEAETHVEITNPFQLSESFRQLIQRRKTYIHKVVNDEVPLSDCVAVITNNLKIKDQISFQELLPEVCKTQHVISMFLGILELTKLQMTSIDQEVVFGPILITRKVDLDTLDHAQDAIRGMSWQ